MHTSLQNTLSPDECSQQQDDGWAQDKGPSQLQSGIEWPSITPRSTSFQPTKLDLAASRNVVLPCGTLCTRVETLDNPGSCQSTLSKCLGRSERVVREASKGMMRWWTPRRRESGGCINGCYTPTTSSSARSSQSSSFLLDLNTGFVDVMCCLEVHPGPTRKRMWLLPELTTTTPQEGEDGEGGAPRNRVR